MSSISEKLDQLSPLQRAVYALKETRGKLERLEQAQTEPIAIVGMGCRFPGGANDPESFWQILHNGIDTIKEVPASRWDIDVYHDPNPETPGKMYVRQGGFLEVGLDEFDAEFFGLAPREAVSMDPQQRLLLEVSWEALENAAIAPNKLAGSSTGVFVGMSANDYAQRTMFDVPSVIDVYTATGNALNAAAGRLSYILGLQGPSMVIDTACSSSLVAVHLACQSLRTQDCQLAIAGGVNLILSPQATIAMSKLRALAADGRCKTFDATADGYGRGEGCGMVVLKCLSKAIADGDRILAVIRGSAVNQDGRSSGLTVPNGLAQQQVIRAALANAKVEPEEISYVEAHGTGTPLGDPVELKALDSVLGKGGSAEQSLMVGSVKTNIGHLEAAAGIAGLIKVVLAMQHQEIPPHLHLKELNPHIVAQQNSVVIPTEPVSWQQNPERQRLAGISSFGFTGTNAHVVLEEAPVKESTPTTTDRPLHLLTLSAKSETALQTMAADMTDYLAQHQETSLADFCFTANTGRAHFDHRAAVVADSLEEIGQQLAAIAARKERELLPISQPKIAFLFTGQGSQYIGMGRQLYDTQPTFRKALEHCDAILRSYLDWSLLEILYADTHSSNGELNETAYTQPALFALEYALAKLWQSWGIEPDAVIGHSVGEYIAACIAGVFSLEDGLKLVAERGKLMQALPANGQMAAVFTDEATIARAIEPYGSRVAIAAINSPKNTVISGEYDAVEALLQQLKEGGTEFHRLQVSHPFHSPLMEPILTEFASVASEVTYCAPQLELISNVTGLLAEKEIAASYWCHHIQKPVRFATGIKTLRDRGYQIFVEIGPHPVLSGMGRQCSPEESVVWLPSLRRGQSDWQQLLLSLKSLYEYGVEVDWSGFERDYQRNRLSLPTYPFQRQRYWLAPVERQPLRTVVSSSKINHPFLGQRLHSPLQQIQFESQFSLDLLPLVRDHRLGGIPFLNAVIYLEMALAGAREEFGKAVHLIEDVFISHPLTLSEEEKRSVQLILEPLGSDKASFQIFSLTNSEADEQTNWILHASGKLGLGEIEIARLTQKPAYFENPKGEYQQEFSRSQFYQLIEETGGYLGPSCQWVERIWVGDEKAFAKIDPPQTASETDEGYQLPLGVIDAGTQLLIGILLDLIDEPIVMVGIESFRFYGYSPKQLWSDACIQLYDNNQTITANIRIFDEAGQLVAEFINVQLRHIEREALLNACQGKQTKALAIVKGSLSREQILAAASEKHQSMLEIYLIEELAKALQLPPSKLNPQQSLTSLLDSLIIFELKKQIEVDLQVVVSTTKFFEETSIAELAAVLLELLALNSKVLSKTEKALKNASQKAGSLSQENDSTEIVSTKPVQAVDSSLGFQEVKIHSVAATVPQENLWIASPQVNNQACIRLFCFPYAGAGASMFNSWTEFLPAKIQICPIQLPARESRWGEPPATRLKPLIQTLAPLLKPELDIPFAFFGHSLGALLAFELAREFRRQNGPAPVHLFVSSSSPPQLPNRSRPIHRLPEPQFIEELKRLKGIPEEILQDSELMQLFLPTLRADFAILETYFYVSEEPLDCPISTFGGLEDDKVNREVLTAWQEQTSSDFTMQMFPGDHFFLRSEGRALVQSISKKLLSSLEG